MKLQTWVHIELAGSDFAVEIERVREFVSLNDLAIVPMPRTTPHIRGVLNLRGRIFPVVDLRSCLGLMAAHHEVDSHIQMLKEREADHVKWLDELQACVNEERPFRLATDPHKCKFGQWYDKHRDGDARRRFTGDNLVLESVLNSFDVPHKKIHAIASDVDSLVRQGELDKARGLIEQTRSRELKAMIELFSTATEAVKEMSRQLVMVVELDGVPAAVIIDAVESVFDLDPSEIQPAFGMLIQALTVEVDGVRSIARTQ